MHNFGINGDINNFENNYHMYNHIFINIHTFSFKVGQVHMRSDHCQRGRPESPTQAKTESSTERTRPQDP
jgi:hypothetical protein